MKRNLPASKLIRKRNIKNGKKSKLTNNKQKFYKNKNN